MRITLFKYRPRLALAWWLPAFAHALQRKVDSLEAEGEPGRRGYIRELAKVLMAWIPMERAVLGIESPTELAAPNPTEQDEMDCAGCGAEQSEAFRPETD